jgi:hypothetical protein
LFVRIHLAKLSAGSRSAPQGLELVQQKLARRERWFGDGVVDPAAGAAVDDEAGLAEDPEVMRHERLTHLQPLRQVTDGHLARDELLEDAQPCLVAQGAEAEGGDGATAIVGRGHGEMYKSIFI